MANPNVELIDALRKTADRLDGGAKYAWGHHGQCNCGNLVQTITTLTHGEILKYAQTGIGEWTEIAQDYCPVSNAPADLLVHKLESLGLTPVDIHHIEYLSDKDILRCLPGGFRWLRRNVREDVIQYFRTMADVLESRLLDLELTRNMRELKTDQDGVKDCSKAVQPTI